MRDEFMPELGIRILIAYSCAKWHGIFKGLSQDGGRAKLAEYLRASPFKKELSNETTYSLIYLAGQYL